MKTHRSLFRHAMVLLIATLMSSALAAQSTFYTIEAGDWNDPAIWSYDNNTPAPAHRLWKLTGSMWSSMKP
ncbi:MAG: hypothetical protein R3330_14960 [Saprospiraceae bacterium]|nr:hypothetical protein [Saprospiraceae bacterium]